MFPLFGFYDLRGSYLNPATDAISIFLSFISDGSPLRGGMANALTRHPPNPDPIQDNPS